MCYFFQKKYKHAFTISIITPPWHDIVSWNPSSCKTRICLSYIVNIIAADDLGMQVARASATIMLTYLNRENSVLVR